MIIAITILLNTALTYWLVKPFFIAVTEKWNNTKACIILIPPVSIVISGFIVIGCAILTFIWLCFEMPPTGKQWRDLFKKNYFK